MFDFNLLDLIAGIPGLIIAMSSTSMLMRAWP